MKTNPTVKTLALERKEHGLCEVEKAMRVLSARLIRVTYTRTHAIVTYI